MMTTSSIVGHGCQRGGGRRLRVEARVSSGRLLRSRAGRPGGCRLAASGRCPRAVAVRRGSAGGRWPRRGLRPGGIRRRVTLDNLAAAFPERTEPERRAIARGAYANMARAVVRLAPERSGDSREELRGRVGGGRLRPGGARARPGPGTPGAPPRTSVAGSCSARRWPSGFRCNAVVRPLRGGLNARLVEARQRAGLGLIPPRGALLGTVAALRRNEVVAMLIDQAIGGKHALFVPFFGRPAATTPALSMAALRTGAPTLVVVALREARPAALPRRGARSRSRTPATASGTSSPTPPR